MLVDRLDHRLQGQSVLPGQFLQVLVKRVAVKVIIDIAHQMKVALLLETRYRIVSGVEVGDQDASKLAEGLLEDRAFPSRMIEVDDKLRARESPDIPNSGLLELDFRLVGMDQVS